MAANIQQRGLLKVVTGETVGAPSKPDVGIGQVSLASTGAAEAGAAAEKSWEAIAKDLSSVGEVIGTYADHAAKVEGAKAGHLAGLDPEFRPTGATTIRGEAFDKAGLATYESTVKIEIEKDIDAGGDLAKKQAAWTSRVPDELKPEVTHQFRRAELTRAREATRAAAAEAAAEAKGALLGEIDQSVRGLHQRASALGLDGKADEVLGQDLALLEKTLRRAGPDGKPMVSPVEAQRILSSARETVADARLSGAFQRLPSVEAKQAFLEKLDADFKGSTGIAQVYDFPSYQRIRHHLEADLKRSDSERRVAASAIVDEVKEATKLVEKGYALKPEQLAGLRTRALAGGDPLLLQHIDGLEELGAWQSEARMRSPAALDGYAQQLQEKIRKYGPNQAIVSRLEMTKKLADEARTQIKQDPLGWADRVGAMKVAPLQLNGDAAAGSVKIRIAQAEEVANVYGIQPIYLRPEEKRRLAVEASKGGDHMLAVTTAITRAAGDRAPKVLAEIFDHAPVVAMTGWHVAKVGVSAVSEDVAAGMALQKSDGFKPLAPSADVARTAALAAHGGALSRLPETEQTAIAMTNAAYERRARTRGLSSFDEGLWKQTFSEVMGLRKIGGEYFGGVARSGEEHVIVPPNVKTRALPELVQSIELADLADNPPGYKDGRQASLADIRRASLVSVADGKYWMNLGTPAAPRYLQGQNGQPYVLDLEALEPVLKERRPDLYLGGGERKERAPVTIGRRAPPGMMRLGGPVDGAGDRQPRTLDDPTATAVVAGERSMTADRDKLAVAEILHKRGADQTQTWIETGWWRGGDGKWRSEIPDTKAELDLPSYDGKPQQTTTLGKVLRHPDLFKAYPDFANVAVRLVDAEELPSRPGLPAGTYGLVEKGPDGKPMITIATANDADAVRAAILHEVQHIAQGTERFNYGAALPYAKRPGEIEARAVETRANMTPEQLAANPPFAQQPMKLGGPDDQSPEQPARMSPRAAMRKAADTVSEDIRRRDPPGPTLKQAAEAASLFVPLPGSVGMQALFRSLPWIKPYLEDAPGQQQAAAKPQQGGGAGDTQPPEQGASGIPHDLGQEVGALAKRLDLDEQGRQRLEDLMFSDHMLAGIDTLEMMVPGPERDRFVQSLIGELERAMRRKR